MKIVNKGRIFGINIIDLLVGLVILAVAVAVVGSVIISYIQKNVAAEYEKEKYEMHYNCPNCGRSTTFRFPMETPEPETYKDDCCYCGNKVWFIPPPKPKAPGPKPVFGKFIFDYQLDPKLSDRDNLVRYSLQLKLAKDKYEREKIRWEEEQD